MIRAATRDIRRLVSISRSPVYAGFVEALEGAPTVRAFGCQAVLRLIAQNERQVEEFVTAQFAEEATNLWLGLRLAVRAQSLPLPPLLPGLLASLILVLAVFPCLWATQRASEGAPVAS